MIGLAVVVCCLCVNSLFDSAASWAQPQGDVIEPSLVLLVCIGVAAAFIVWDIRKAK